MIIDYLSYCTLGYNYGVERMYYNKEERLMRESIPVELSGGRSEGALLSTPTTKKEVRMEMRDYFRDRQFILETLSPREAKIFTMYYGIDGQKPMTYEQIGEVLGVTRSRIGQEVAKIHRKLRHPTRVREYMFLTDKDLGYTPQGIVDNHNNHYYELDEAESEKAIYEYNKVIEEKLNAKRQARFDALSTEERKANELLANLLQVRLVDFARMMNIDVDIKELHKAPYNVGELLAIKKSVLIEDGFNEFVEKIESLGLHFYEEFEYLEDFNKKCYKSMIKTGLENIEQLISSVPVSAPSLDIPIEELDMSVRSFNCLKRAGVDTVGDIVVMSTSQLAQVRNIGSRSCMEVISLVRSIGFELRPESIEPKRWLDILVKNKDDVNIGNIERLNEDKKILRLSDEANMALWKAGKYFINDLVSMTSADYAEIEGLTEQDIKIIDSRLKALGFGICPDGVDPKKWIKKFIAKPLDAKPAENHEELNINEISRM